MAASYFDKMSHEITCPHAQCGKVFKKTYRRLFHADKIACPECRRTIDIRKSKSTGEIGSWFNTVAELDKKRRKK